MTKRASLTAADIFRKKGEAAPAPIAPSTPLAAVAPSKPVPAGRAATKRVALTVKLDADTYERLRLYAFTHRTSHQELIERAVLGLLGPEA